MKSDSVKYWKVIRAKNRSSVIVESPDISITYPINKWVKPKIVNSKIMIFDDYNKASEWLSQFPAHYNLIIVSCVAKRIRKTKLNGLGLIDEINSVQHVKKFWKWFYLRTSNNQLQIRSCFPNGTVFASEIKCLE